MAASNDTGPTLAASHPTLGGQAKAKVLILGGTAEARALALRLADTRCEPVTSLAGTTRHPAGISGKVRSGGFGGAAGLADYVAEEGIRAIVDATHPFAIQISRHAKDAADRLGLPLIRLERPTWTPEREDRWTDVEDHETAAQALPAGAHVLLTIGRKELQPYLQRPDISGIARMIEAPAIEIAGNWRVLLARPPFGLDQELSLFTREAISHLVTKNAGGEETRAKLMAARRIAIAVVMIRRPRKPEVPTVDTVQRVVAFLDQVLNA
jgi:precorrin-6A/cobalt-precorrin-6A reductase